MTDTDTITIRPTAAAELESGLLVRHHGETRQILRVREYDKDRIVFYFHDGSDVRWADAMVDVIVPPEPEADAQTEVEAEPEAGPAPEPAGEAGPPWPTAPVLRVTFGWVEYNIPVDDHIAFRAGDGVYTVPGVGDIVRGRVGDGIIRWEDLTCLPTRTYAALCARVDALDDAMTRDMSHHQLRSLAEHIVQTARGLSQQGTTGQEAVD